MPMLHSSLSFRSWNKPHQIPENHAAQQTYASRFHNLTDISLEPDIMPPSLVTDTQRTSDVCPKRAVEKRYGRSVILPFCRNSLKRKMCCQWINCGHIETSCQHKHWCQHKILRENLKKKCLLVNNFELIFVLRTWKLLDFIQENIFM